MSRVRLPLCLLLAPLALASAGCGKVREIRACNGVVHEANGALDEIERLSKQKPLDAQRIANRYGSLAKSLATRAQGETPFAVAVREYVAVLQATETAVKAHDSATKTQYGRVAEPRRDLERLMKRERSAASRIEAVCH
jgi:hypothetical protein